ncbi:MAG: cytochrome c3 family protein [Deltaproteobacteria bacterium]|nr:cytochrome c3 family protein [Deltaproteobacteria bacterium]
MKHLKGEFLSLRKRTRLILVLLVAFFVLIGGLSTIGYRYVQHDPRFCTSCHIMEDPYEKWSESPHHLVDCHSCHKQGTKEKLWQVWFYVTQRPDEVVHHPELDHKVCAQCHLSKDEHWKQIGETAGHKIHFEKAGIDCLACHMGGVHEFLRPIDSCVTCHADKAEGPGKKMAFAHCTDCHNFLGKKDNLMPARKDCLACHEKIKVGREKFPKDAPMSDFDCGTCHKPHEKIRPDSEVCLACHTDVGASHYGKTADQTCTACHKPHTWKTTQK